MNDPLHLASRMPSPKHIRKIGMGGQVVDNLRLAQEHLAKSQQHLGEVDWERCNDFQLLVEKAVITGYLDESERLIASELMRWIDKRRPGLEASYPKLGETLLQLLRSVQWLGYYEGARQPLPQSPALLGTDHKRPSKQAGYVQPNRDKKVGVVTYVTPETNELFKAAVRSRGTTVVAFLRAFIEEVASEYARGPGQVDKSA